MTRITINCASSETRRCSSIWERCARCLSTNRCWLSGHATCSSNSTNMEFTTIVRVFSWIWVCVWSTYLCTCCCWDIIAILAVSGNSQTIENSCRVCNWDCIVGCNTFGNTWLSWDCSSCLITTVSSCSTYHLNSTLKFCLIVRVRITIRFACTIYDTITICKISTNCIVVKLILNWINKTERLTCDSILVITSVSTHSTNWISTTIHILSWEI